MHRGNHTVTTASAGGVNKAQANNATPLSTQLNLTGVDYRINSRAILDSVDLALPATGITSVLGFNGAGKSVLLKIMHGIVSPSKGHVRWGEQPNNAEHRFNQAMVFQKPVLLRRSVKANIEFVLKKRDNPSAPNCNALLELVGLERVASQAARRLSGGEQQRLALARALACQPRILFLDEATASLDTASTAIIETIVQDCANTGTKVIMVTHDAAQAARLSDDVVFMHAGAVSEHAPSSTFFNHPVSAPAKAYLNGQLYTEDL